MILSPCQWRRCDIAKKRESNLKKNGVSSELLPREQMERAASPHDLKDEAVLAILLKTGAPGCDVLELARRLIRAFGCIQDPCDRRLAHAGREDSGLPRRPNAGRESNKVACRYAT